MKPRVLRIITRLNVGGPATHVQLVNAGLDSQGWETLLAYGDVDAEEAEAPLRGDINAARVAGLQRSVSPARDARAFAGIVRLVRSFRPHIIHTHLSKAGLIGRSAGLATSSAARVHTFHGNVFEGYFSPRVSQAVLRVERSLGARTHAILALSETQRSELLERGIAPESQIRVVPLGTDLTRYGVDRAGARERLALPADQPIVVAIGRMVPIKRLDRLFRAFDAVVREIPNAHLYLVGGGPERASLEALAVELGIRQHMTFVGWSTQTPDWYGAANVVALSSDREGTPLAVIEAAASGRPVVATAVGGVPDVVDDGRTGVVVASGDEAALARGITALLRDADRADRMGAAAQSRSHRFGAQRLIDDLDSVYRDLLQGRR